MALADAWASWLESIVGIFSFGTVSDSPYIELAKKKNNKNPSLGGKPWRWRVLLGGTAWGHFCCSGSGDDTARGLGVWFEAFVYWRQFHLFSFCYADPSERAGRWFWKITIKTLHFSEYITGSLFSAQSQESVAISRYWDTADVVTVATLWPPQVCIQEMDERLSRVPQACLQALSWIISLAPIISCKQISSDLEVIARIIPASGSNDLRWCHPLAFYGND